MNFITGALSVELAPDHARTRDSLNRSPAEYQETIRNGLAEIIRTRSLSTLDYLKLTNVEFADEDALYRYLAEEYAFLFGEGVPADGSGAGSV
jgi:hypothetical protein